MSLTISSLNIAPNIGKAGAERSWKGLDRREVVALGESQGYGEKGQKKKAENDVESCWIGGLDTFDEIVVSEEVGIVLEEPSNVGHRYQYHSCWDCNHGEDGTRYNWIDKGERRDKKCLGESRFPL